MTKPTKQMSNLKDIETPNEHIKPYLSTLQGYQEKAYLEMLQILRHKKEDIDIDVRKDRLVWLRPIQALNMVYPSNKAKTGTKGLHDIMEFKENTFNYKQTTLSNQGRIFSRDKIIEYSSKISNICEIIRNSTGSVLIYSHKKTIPRNKWI
jgi:hypothetical protein